MAGVTIQNMTKTYGNGAIRAVDSLNLDIKDGEFMILVGPSGCGKSTALRMIAGLEEISDGGVWIGDRFVNDMHPKARNTAMVFQNYALYPHLTVFDNIAFPLQIARLPRTEIARRVQDAARILELGDYLKRRPGHLSGGQRQRVAMGRAIVRQPDVFLMDEPLSNLDAKLRVQMRAEISGLQRRLGTTTIYVTHDQVEAMTMGDRVALMRDGVLQQVDAPTVLYDSPANMFVAAFIGSPSMNLFRAILSRGDAGEFVLVSGSLRIAVPAGLVAARPALGGLVDRPVVFGIRAEDMCDARTLGADADAAGVTVSSAAATIEELGSDLLVHFDIEADQIHVANLDLVQELGAGGGSRVIARFAPRSGVRQGTPVQVRIDTNRLHFFDPKTERAI